jgi:hypothetical protein
VQLRFNLTWGIVTCLECPEHCKAYTEQAVRDQYAICRYLAKELAVA